MDPLPATELVVVVCGFLIAFALAFGIGANDVANSFGTSVGSKALTLRTACVLASICELSGSILLGARVSNTIRKNMLDLEQYENSTNGATLLMYGYVSALGGKCDEILPLSGAFTFNKHNFTIVGSCIWLFVATLFKLPVSGSHSIVGAVIGFSLVRFGVGGINWGKVGQIGKCH